MSLYRIRVAVLSGLYLLIALVAYSCSCQCDNYEGEECIINNDSANCKWIAAEDGAIPENAVSVGYEDETEIQLYAARVSCDNNILPAVITTNTSQARTVNPSGGRIISFRKYEVLSNINVTWVDVINGELPKNAIVVGYTVGKRLLYIGQYQKEGLLRIGTIGLYGNGLVYVPMNKHIISYPATKVMAYPKEWPYSSDSYYYY